MLKRTLASTLALASCASFTTQAVAHQPKTGIYLGAALGGAATTGKSTLSLSRNIPALGAVVPQIYDANVGDKNVAADIFIGYGKRINCFHIGLEALASFTSLNSKSPLDVSPLTTSNNGQLLSVKTTNAWGATFNIGYHINQPTKLYLKLGFESRNFRSTFSSSIPQDPNILNLNFSKRGTAFVPGLGLETDLNPRTALRAEYRAALHTAKTGQVANSATQFTSIKTKPTIHYFNLGLTFRI